MKNFQRSIAFLAIFALLFTSCSKEEGQVRQENSDKATLSFGAVINDLTRTSKQTVGDIPACSDDVPYYVEIVLMQGDDYVVGSSSEPYRVDLAAGQIFTVEDSALELPPGDYTLDHFAVYNEEGTLIWIAPRLDGELASYVDNALPLAIDLNAGVKKYVDVSVLCFDDRLVNEYGYLFFELDANQAIKFCFFGNYCPPSGRHYPASYTIDVWYGTSAEGTPLYTNVSNVTGQYDNGDYYADPLCFALPDNEGEDNYYFEITIDDSDAYGDIENRIIRQGVITDDEVRNFFDGDNNLDYYHFRAGCENNDSPPIFIDPEEEATHYKACLKATNNSSAFGFAYMKLQGNTLQTTVLATGLEIGQSHMQHIHENATCDNAGPPIFWLDQEDGTWPVATGAYGDIVYHRTFTLGTDEQHPGLPVIDPLESRTVNLHGMTVGDTYNAGIVVACGSVEKVE